MAEFINFYLIPGLVLGSIYALGAIGITLTFGILRFANFCHGEFMTLGVYFAWSLVQLTSLHPLVVMPQQHHQLLWRFLPKSRRNQFLSLHT